MTGTPKYRQIADALRERITSGQLQPGDEVPGENALMAEHGVARETARRALAVLSAEGLTDARRGRKTLVRNFKPIIRIETTRSSAWKTGRSMWENDVRGREFATDQMDVRPAAAPDRVARVLGTADVGLRSRRYVVDRRPGILADSYLPIAIVEGTQIMEPDTGPGGTYARLRDLGHEVSGFSMQVWSRPPEGDEAARLDLPARSWVLCGVRTAFTDTGRAVEVNEMVMNPTLYVLQFDYPA